MRIGLSTLVFYPRVYAGVGSYVRHLADAFASASDENEYLLVAARWNAEAFQYANPRVQTLITNAPYNHPLCALWEHRAMGGIARKGKIELFHAPSNVAPRGLDCRIALTFHDLLPYWVPESYSRARRLYWYFAMPRSLRRADVVLTDTEACRLEIIRRWQLSPERVVAVPLGVDSAHFSQVPEAERGEMRRRFGGPYAFWTGRPFPYKNLPRLIEAFALAKRLGKLPQRLVLGGQEAGADAGVQKAIEKTGLADAFVTPGRLSFAELPAVYAGADAFLFPSLNEGFGLPVLEAMAAGTPVLTSKRDVLAETAAGAALLVDPKDAPAMAMAVRRLLEDAPLRAELSERGRRHATAMTWANTAAGTLAAYQVAVA